MAEREYKDSEGNVVTLDKLVRIEPEWAANIIRWYEGKLDEYEKLWQSAQEGVGETPVWSVSVAARYEDGVLLEAIDAAHTGARPLMVPVEHFNRLLALRRAETAEHKKALLRLDTAERALERHGYRRSCNIPACNCGDQWNHGGHAAERLREISDEVYTNGKTVLQAVKDVCAERDRYRNALELLRPGIEIDLRYADPDDDIDALRSRAQTIREALSDE